MTRQAILAVLTLATGCGSSSLDPFPDVRAETVGDDFSVVDGFADIPVTVANESTGATYYVWMGPGGICASLDRLSSRGWQPQGADTCYPASAVAVAPGTRLDSQTLFYSDDAGTYRLRVHVGRSADQSGYSSAGEPVEPTNAFRVHSDG